MLNPQQKSPILKQQQYNNKNSLLKKRGNPYFNNTKNQNHIQDFKNEEEDDDYLNQNDDESISISLLEDQEKLVKNNSNSSCNKKVKFCNDNSHENHPQKNKYTRNRNILNFDTESSQIFTPLMSSNFNSTRMASYSSGSEFPEPELHLSGNEQMFSEDYEEEEFKNQQHVIRKSSRKNSDIFLFSKKNTEENQLDLTPQIVKMLEQKEAQLIQNQKQQIFDKNENFQVQCALGHIFNCNFLKLKQSSKKQSMSFSSNNNSKKENMKKQVRNRKKAFDFNEDDEDGEHFQYEYDDEDYEEENEIEEEEQKNKEMKNNKCNKNKKYYYTNNNNNDSSNNNISSSDFEQNQDEDTDTDKSAHQPFCQLCSQKYEKVQDYAKQNKGILISDAFQIHLKFQCQLGHQFILGHKDYHRRWCVQCKQILKKEFKEYLKSEEQKQQKEYEQKQEELYAQARRQYRKDSYFANSSNMEDSSSGSDSENQKQLKRQNAQKIIEAAKIVEKQLENVAKGKVSNFMKEQSAANQQSAEISEFDALQVYIMLLYPENVLSCYFQVLDKANLIKQYRGFARNIHPDKNHHPESSKAFQKLNQHYHAALENLQQA